MNTKPFIIYPAIDLRQGQVVRLVQGDPDRQTVYHNDPAKAAQRWIEAGARWLHVVNLDGAFGEKGIKNLDALKNILSFISSAESSATIQWGGGIRTRNDIRQLLTLGVQRVILGSVAVETPEIMVQALDEFGSNHIALAMDVKNQQVFIRGWVKSTTENPVELGQRFYENGLRTCIYTDIQRDGGGTGLNITATHQFSQLTGLEVIASGGVASIQDVKQARDAALAGVIIGKALYAESVSLSEALSYQTE